MFQAKTPNVFVTFVANNEIIFFENALYDAVIIFSLELSLTNADPALTKAGVFLIASQLCK